MQKKYFRKILYAVGSLPFWTGKSKLIQFLSGKPGSFWEKESPLKPVYLNQPLFGALEDLDDSSIRRSLQSLLNSGYLCYEKISEDKPYTVIKFTNKGAKKYYNLLVIDKNLREPYWWLRHVSRIRSEPNSPINTGGELLVFNDKTYLTQAPPYLDNDDRMQSDETVRLMDKNDFELTTGHYELHSVGVGVREFPFIYLNEDTDLQKVTRSDFADKISHFSSNVSQLNPPDPYVIKGKLSSSTAPNEEGIRRLKLKNNYGKSLIINIKTNQIPDELELIDGETYVVGPLREAQDDNESGTENFYLELDDDGQIHKSRRGR